jgi:hypothetical protein
MPSLKYTWRLELDWLQDVLTRQLVHFSHIFSVKYLHLFHTACTTHFNPSLIKVKLSPATDYALRQGDECGMEV